MNLVMTIIEVGGLIVVVVIVHTDNMQHDSPRSMQCLDNLDVKC